MSREIKFRAWDKKTNKVRDVMEYDYSTNEIGLCSVPNRMFRYGVLHTIHSIKRHVDDVILMQYTGLKDKNSVEIYEGSIMRDSDNIVGVIEVEDGNTCWNWENISTLLSENHDTLETIGNIYENPELIDKEIEK